MSILFHKILVLVVVVVAMAATTTTITTTTHHGGGVNAFTPVVQQQQRRPHPVFGSTSIITTSSSRTSTDVARRRRRQRSRVVVYSSTIEKQSDDTITIATTAEETTSTSTKRNTNNKDDDNDNDDIPLAPLTVWGSPYIDIVAEQARARQMELPEFSMEIVADNVIQSLDASSSSSTTTTTTTMMSREDMELQYLTTHRIHIVHELLQDHGCVIFRNFTLMTTPSGFLTFTNALQLQTCCDPLHSVSARPTIAAAATTTTTTTTGTDSHQTTTTKKSPIYEAVNKESRKNFFIGMHNEFVGTRAPAGAAFVCFTAAPVGGEFLIADARRIFQQLPSSLLQTLYQQQIRYSVMELPFFTFLDTNPMIIEPLRQPLANLIRTIITFAMNAKVDFDIDLQWITNNNSNHHHHPNDSHATNVGGSPDASTTVLSTKPTSPSPPTLPQRILQARAPKQPPVVAHPITNEPVWFCNVHSHSAVLRSQRELLYGAERFEDGASQINKSDMYFGNDEPLSLEQLQILDEVTNAQIKYVKMLPGDVVLLDNYKTLHGRNVFDGVRKHGVAWFEGWE